MKTPPTKSSQSRPPSKSSQSRPKRGALENNFCIKPKRGRISNACKTLISNELHYCHNCRLNLNVGKSTSKKNECSRPWVLSVSKTPKKIRNRDFLLKKYPNILRSLDTSLDGTNLNSRFEYVCSDKVKKTGKFFQIYVFIKNPEN